MTWLKKLAPLAFAMAVLGFAGPYSQSALAVCEEVNDQRDIDALVPRLMAGGNIILIRHGQKAPKEKGQDDCNDVELTSCGEGQARRIGANLPDSLSEKVGAILHSSCKRTTDTAYQILSATGWTHITPVGKDELRKGMGVAKLRAVMNDFLSDPRQANKNAVIVAHSPEIHSLGEVDDLTCGEAAVLSRGNAGSGFVCHRRLMPEEWSTAWVGNPPTEIYWPDCTGRKKAQEARRVPSSNRVASTNCSHLEP